MGYSLHIKSDGKIQYKEKAGVNDIFLTSPGTYNDNTWHHVAVVVDTSAGQKTGYLYIDGVLVKSDTYSGDLLDYNGDLFIGSDDGSADFFKGRIGDVALYHSALTNQQILDILFTFTFYSNSSGPRSNLVFTGDFENQSYSPDFKIHTSTANWPTFSNTESWGNYSSKSYLDGTGNTTTNKYRTEIRFENRDMELDTLAIDDDNEIWYGISIFLPTSYVSDPIWEVVLQWHARQDDDDGEESRNPPLSLLTTGGEWSIDMHWDSKAITPTDPYIYDGTKVIELGAYTTDEWTDWVFHIKWSYDNDGILEIWKNGKLVVNHHGPNSYNDDELPYFAWGMYKGWRNTDPLPENVSTRTIYHDEVMVGDKNATYNDVAP